MISISLNGRPYETQSQTLAELVVELGLVGKRIAIEMDGELVPKSRHVTTQINADARIEIVHAVGGG